MRDPWRIASVVSEVQRLWGRMPELRLGQFLSVVVGQDIFDIEDDELLKRLRDFEDWQELVRHLGERKAPDWETYRNAPNG